MASRIPSYLLLRRAIIPKIYLHELLWNNTKVWLILLFGGFLFSIPTTIVLVINYSSFGWSAAQYLFQDQGGKLLTAVVPHLFFECFALITISGIALTITHYEFCFLQNNRKRDISIDNATLLSLFVVFISWFSLFWAAIIETYISHI
ncbi:stage II sporulation protein M [Bifidobacterium amazonense]|uniref:stage II sporulation protein M n=1 Tax=Bifidobacterium amazonense TaxID=2809027 RepID=UPI003B849C9D